MAGRLIDLSNSDVPLPPHLAIDTNVLAVRLFAPPEVSTQFAVRRARVRAALAAIRQRRIRATATPTVLRELIHIAIRTRYRQDLAAHADDVGGRKSWELLFKARPDLMSTYEPTLRRIPLVLESLGVLIAQPTDTFSITSDMTFEQDLIDTVVRFGLNSADASILIEMRGMGIDSLLTEDPDMRRAIPEFDIYTWL